MNNNDDTLPPLTFCNQDQVDPESELPFFVRRPPVEFAPLQEIRENIWFVAFGDPEINEATFIQLYAGIAVFTEERNPLALIETFLGAHREKLYPPLWVLDYIAKAFEEYYKLQGTKTLDEVFKLKVGKGQTPLFKAALEDERDEIMCLQVFKLNVLFKISIEDCCFVVSQYFQEEDWNKTSHDMRDISQDTLQDRYKRKWRKICEAAGIRESVLSWDEDKKKVFLYERLEKLSAQDIDHLKEKYSL